MKSVAGIICVCLCLCWSIVYAGEVVNEKDGRTFHQLVYQRSPESKIAELTLSDVMFCRINLEEGSAIMCTHEGKQVKTDFKELYEAGWNMFLSSDRKDGSTILLFRKTDTEAINKNGLWVLPVE